MTLIAETHAPDDAYAEMAVQFSDDEILDISYAIVAINAWNPLAIGFRAEAKSEAVSAPPPLA